MPLPPKISQWAIFFARVFVGAVFAYAGYSKLMEPVENFRGLIAEYQVFPSVVIPLIASTLPWLELLFGVFLILGYATRLSASCLLLFSLTFIAVIFLSWLKLGKFPDACGCFGEGGIHLTGWQVLCLDAVNSLIGLILIRSKRHFWTLDAKFVSP